MAYKGKSKTSKTKDSYERKGSKSRKDVEEKGKDKKFPCIIKEAGKGNDFAWYNRNGNLTNIASSYFLSNPAGKPVGNLNHTDGKDSAIPGILTIEMLPAFAPTTTNADTASTSGLNLSAKQLYAALRKANAGARSQYEAPDLLLYVLSIESIYAFLAACVRAYGFLSQFPTMNRYYAQHVVEAMGFDFDDLLENRLEFYNFINTSILQLRRFVVPAGFTSVNRSVWVNSNVFVDTDSTVKAQIYIPKYVGYWQFDSTTMETGGCLKMSYIGNTPRTVAQLRAYFNALIAPIAQDDDFLTISGDIMKFTDSYFTLEPISEDFILNPIYDEMVMLQIHNMDFITLDNTGSSTGWEVADLGDYPSDIPFNSTYTIFQKDGLLYFQPMMNLGQNPTVTNYYLQAYDKIHAADGSVLYIDTPEDSPSVERITEATRLITTYNIAEAAGDALPIDSCGHEIVVGVTLYTDHTSFHVQQYMAVSSATLGILSLPGFVMLAGMSSYNWDIRVSLGLGLDTSDPTVVTHWNTRSVGTFDKASFKRLNDIITMSLLTY